MKINPGGNRLTYQILMGINGAGMMLNAAMLKATDDPVFGVLACLCFVGFIGAYQNLKGFD